VNAVLQHAANRLAQSRGAPGSVPVSQLEAEVAAREAASAQEPPPGDGS
jgi:hypothetical protein